MGEWKRWFAFYPVKLKRNTFVLGRVVWRRKRADGTWEYSMFGPEFETLLPEMQRQLREYRTKAS